MKDNSNIQSAASGGFSTRALLFLAFKHFGAVVVSFLAVVGMVVIGTLIQEPKYKAESVIVVEPMARGVAVLEDVVTLRPTDDVDTQVEVLSGRTIVEELVDTLSLCEMKPFSEFKEEDGHERREKTIDHLRKNVIDIRPLKRSNAIKISVLFRDPVAAQKIANGLAGLFVTGFSKERKDEAAKTYTYLKEQLEAAGKQLTQSEIDLRELKESRNIVSVFGTAAAYRATLSEFEGALANTDADLREAEAGLASLIAQLDKLDATILAQADTTDNPLAEELKLQLSRLQIERGKLSERYTDKHPLMMDVDRQITSAKSQLSETKDKKITAELSRPNPLVDRLNEERANTEAMVESLRARKDSVAATVDDFTRRLGELPAIEAEVNRLERERKVNEDAYLLYSQKLEQSRIAKGMGANVASNMRIVDRASVATKPARPNKLLNLALGIFIGSIFAIAVAFIREMCDHRLDTIEKAERLSGVPVLVAVPMLRELSSLPQNTVEPRR
ncbi:GumC family protein [Candidatus Hydrogenedentota bacterium]